MENVKKRWSIAYSRKTKALIDKNASTEILYIIYINVSENINYLFNSFNNYLIEKKLKLYFFGFLR